MILRARCILPIGEAPIENGALVINQGRIAWMGRWRECDTSEDSDIHDLGEVILMPGLINAHAHLDYTSMAGKIPPPRVFPDWVKTILSFKAHWSCSEFAESWLAGARMLVESGVTTVANIESAPELIPQTWETTPLRVLSFLEMTGVRNQRSPEEILSEALDTIAGLPKIPRKEAALSPHSLYSTQPSLIRQCARMAEERNLLVRVPHLAESESEFQMFCDARGSFYDWLKSQRKMDDCGRFSPVQLAAEYGLLSPRFLAVHVNYLARGDAELLGRSGSSVVHCPRSHDYFSHDVFPYDELAKAGVNVCLGTDSLASIRKVAGQSPELNLWSEMRQFSQKYSGIAPRTILGMATLNASKALRKEDQIGQLKAGYAADVITVTYSGHTNESRLFDELLHAGALREVYIAGELVKKN